MDSVRRDITFSVSGDLFDAVQHEIEDVEIAQAAGRGYLLVLGRQRPRQDEWYRLLAEATMRAQAMAGEPRKIVLGARGADRRILVPEHDEIGFAVERQFELLRRIRGVQHQ